MSFISRIFYFRIIREVLNLCGRSYLLIKTRHANHSCQTVKSCSAKNISPFSVCYLFEHTLKITGPYLNQCSGIFSINDLLSFACPSHQFNTSMWYITKCLLCNG